MSTSPNHKAGYIPTFRGKSTPTWSFSPNFKEKDRAQMKTSTDPEMEARKQARHAIEDLQFERQQREVWEQSL